MPPIAVDDDDWPESAAACSSTARCYSPFSMFARSPPSHSDRRLTQQPLTASASQLSSNAPFAAQHSNQPSAFFPYSVQPFNHRAASLSPRCRCRHRHCSLVAQLVARVRLDRLHRLLVLLQLTSAASLLLLLLLHLVLPFQRLRPLASAHCRAAPALHSSPARFRVSRRFEV